MNSGKFLIKLDNTGFRNSNGVVLANLSLTIAPGEILGILGANGSGKSLLAGILAGDLLLPGTERGDDLGAWGLRYTAPEMAERDTASMSFGMQSAIMAAERARDDSDFMEGALDPGRSVETLVRQGRRNDGSGNLTREDGEYLDELLGRFSLLGLRARGLRFLSTGEFRKTLICRALFARPRVLILDEPFTGLDAASRDELVAVLSTLGDGGLSLVIFTSRGTDLPRFCTRAAVLTSGTLIFPGSVRRAVAYYAGLSRKESLGMEGFVREIQGTVENPPPADSLTPCSLVMMVNAAVSYYDTPILKEITWHVREGEHWQIAGPNGAGKSTLLSLINGDSPKAYGQDIRLFGRKRGTGETVWEIKQRIGFVSGAFHLGYLVKQKVLGVILSGFFDSVGLYDPPTPTQKETARLWCRRLGLAAYGDWFFGELSFGIQRTVLLARAMIKDPEILILDEPCQGLDDAHASVVLDAVECIASRNRSTVLYVSHDPSLAVPSIKKRLTLVPHREGGYTAVTTG